MTERLALTLTNNQDFFGARKPRRYVSRAGRLPLSCALKLRILFEGFQGFKRDFPLHSFAFFVWHRTRDYENGLEQHRAESSRRAMEGIGG